MYNFDTLTGERADDLQALKEAGLEYLITKEGDTGEVFSL